ncbi:NUDIX domain-containing protein [Alkaliflexus imshenetskii]|uniref:NUDIX domain-containing protein n=1 Tax=Alkaliflexus imshenetskii TaxID=286730 RepID=UPI0004B4B9AE|nr:NUDIX hydrolase [Alkaliflexus imshenetskii]
MMYRYEYPRPSVTADVVLLAGSEGSQSILLIQRAHEPHKDMWALPGGFVDENEDLPDTAVRELFEETGIERVGLKQIGAFGKPGRDPRGHTITIAFLGIIPDRVLAVAGDDAKHAEWFPINELPPLAFDHHEIIEVALEYRKQLLLQTIAQNQE